MKLYALLLCGAIVAAGAVGCGDSTSDDAPGADSLSVDTNLMTPPLDTTSALDSTNAPVTGDSTAARVDSPSVSKPAVRNDTVGTDGRGASNTATPGVADTNNSGASGVGSGVRRGQGNASAGGRRVNVVEGDTGSASGRRR